MPTKQNRKQKLDDIEEKLRTGIDNFFTSARYRELLRIMSKFHMYSFNNILLIALQCPQATYVTGYQNWKNFNRIVRRGEKAIRIIAPCPYKKENTETGEEEEHIFFRTASVFDISQTIQIPETEEIHLDIPELTTSVLNYENLISAITTAAGIPVTYENLRGSAKGCYYPKNNRIAIQIGMSELQTVKTLIHETAHSRLHNLEATEDPKPDRKTKEIEAESVAFMVAAMLGLDTSDYTFEYIASWSGKDNKKFLDASMKRIRETANILYEDIQKNLAAQKGE